MFKVVVYLLVGLSALLQGTVDGAVYSYREVSSSSEWIDIKVSVVNETAHAALVHKILPRPVKGKLELTNFVSQPVYVSMTTMHTRVHNVKNTVHNLLYGVVIPTKIFLFISKEPHLLDKGIVILPDELLCLAMAGFLNIVYVPNQGPHRKLLPILKKYQKEDVYLVTVDDDAPPDIMHGLLFHLLHTLKVSNYPEAVVSLRSRRMTICKNPPHKLYPYNHWPILQGAAKLEMLVMPTGNPGIMYKPKYFHEVVFSGEFRNITVTTDDLMFRLSTMMKHIPVLLGCGGAENRCHPNHPPVTGRGLQAKLYTHEEQTVGSVPPQSRRLDEVTPSALWTINVRGGNDAAWGLAQTFLQAYGFNFTALAAAHAHEREDSCYPAAGGAVSGACGLQNC